ncbi:hypothetical protein WJX74_003469 [Apatococcus lobatus]|uniref:Uncharacterized protein n=1 Tax=Apatococcus lobatus TaxID=904363 RepID=A0AAW1RS27_9CHLO
MLGAPQCSRPQSTPESRADSNCRGRATETNGVAYHRSICFVSVLGGVLYLLKTTAAWFGDDVRLSALTTSLRRCLLPQRPCLKLNWLQRYR